MTLGQRIYQYRTKQNLSQLEFAERLAVSRQSVSKWETDASVPELEKLVKMCEVFEVTLDELVRGERPPGPQPAAEPQPQPVVIQKLPARLIVGGVLLLCGIMIFMMIWLELHDFWEGLLIGSAVAVPGIICLRARENIGAWCILAELLIWVGAYPVLVAIFSY